MSQKSPPNWTNCGELGEKQAPIWMGKVKKVKEIEVLRDSLLGNLTSTRTSGSQTIRMKFHALQSL
jgi:hypothetical protein